MHFVLNETTERDYTQCQDDSSKPALSRLAELEHSNDVLRHERQIADAANQAKSAFLAHMSHEIRTPINVVLGSLELALRTRLTAEQREYLAMMQSASAALAALINNILDISRIEAGHLEIEHIPFSMREMLGDTLKMMGLEARLKGLELQVDISPALPDTLLGDPNRLRQIVVNLVANAIKFSQRGTIVVRVVPQMSADNEVRCHFSVSDNGIGIPLEKQALIFKPYRQADASTARAYGGSGLGLSIAAHLVELMNGSIRLDSTPGKGSTFHFTVCCGQLPAAHKNAHIEAAQATAQPPECRPNSAGKVAKRRTILLVEDSPMNRRLTQVVLEKEGHRVLLADNGQSALAVLASNPCDLILMDLQMADMDGIEATAAIRRQTSKPIPIIAFTAHALPGDRERCLQAGMDAYLTKPLQPQSLLAAIDDLSPAVPVRTRRVVLDRATLFSRVNGDMNLLREIQQLFLRDYEQLMGDVRRALVNQDAALFSSVLHTLSGMFRSLAANAAYDITNSLETLSVDTEWRKVERLYSRLEREVEVLKVSLADMARGNQAEPDAPQQAIKIKRKSTWNPSKPGLLDSSA